VSGLAERFWAKVDRSGECWLWTGGRSRKGYGKVTVAARTLIATHVALLLDGRPVPPGLCALHRCDTPACVRPDHLFIGSRRDNAQDAIGKGRKPRGSGSALALLTEPAVVAIREAYARGETVAVLAASHGVTVPTIVCVVRGRTWAHAGGPIADAKRPAVRRGSERRTARLDEQMVKAARSRHQAGEPIADLGRAHGVSYKTMQDAVLGRTWRHV
jgi:hypothetical protein